MRAAVSSHSSYPACSAGARPPRNRSARRRSSSVAPAVTRSARRAARRRAASGSADPDAELPPASVPLFSARLRLPASHCSAQSGGSATAGTAPSPSTHSSSSPSACLHGNFRLGQLHLYAGPVASARSTTVWYGLLPLPLQSPHTVPSPLPAPDHGPAAPSLLPALRDAASGASASTCSAVQRTPCSVMPTTVGPATDNRP